MSLTLARRRERERPVVAGAPALRLEGIHAAYERVEVLRGVELTIAPGQVFALLGPNGAGKSTTLRVVSGRLHPVAGRVLVDGYDVTGQSPERLARAGICSVPEGRGVFPNLSVAEHLRMWTFRGGLRRSEVEDAAFGRFPRLAERRHQMAGTLSGGEQQMLAIARALMSQPKLLLLDEPSMGLAPLMVAKIFEIVREVAARGVTVLLVEQNARLALEAASRGYVMESGSITLSGRSKELLSDDRVKEAYLGEARSA